MANRETASLAPKWQDIDVLEAIEKALSPVADFTDILSAENYVTVSTVVPMMHLLSSEIMAPKEEDVELSSDIKQRLVEYLEGKYTDDEGRATHVVLLHVTTLLDPRFKTEYSGEVLRAKSVDMVCLEAVSAIEYDQQQAEREAREEEREAHDMESDAQPHCSQSPSPVPTPAKRRLTIGSLFKGRGKQPQRAEKTTEEVVKLQLESYLSEPCIESDEDPLQWWKQHAIQFPAIARIARKYLCISAMSASSERLFSTAGNVLTPRRSSLNPEKVDMLVFLAKNL